MNDAVWGLYPWFAEDGADLIHPDDREAFRALGPYGRVFQKVGDDDGYMRLRYGERTYRVRPSLFQSVTVPAFDFGQKVRLNRRPDEVGAVQDIMWHHKENRPMYFLNVNGKRVSTRRWEEDLAPA
jgi:hypothetical protein